ncbi:MAG: hypothetical protein LUQ51_05695 [Methanothrix sp.]|nr:hypothetical protein [Methanothrix sp.]OYV11361.1 MAG: hypothetical protein CG446_780 [Methanosaeta sp. ASO1]
MVDLFGKKKLEERILELEAERSRLEGEREDLLRTLEKRDERIKKLSALSQEANLALKAAEQRQAASASHPSAQDKTEQPTEPKLGARKLGLRETDLLLERLHAFRSPREDLLAAYYPGTFPEDPAIPEPLRKAASAIKSRRGGIILHSPQLFSLLLIPPFPVKESHSHEGAAFFLDPILEMMATSVLVVSVHAGDTFLGVSLSRDKFEAEELVQSSVMGRHSKGGWSQKRFERLREEDVKVHIDLVREKLEAMMVKYKPLLHYAVLSGEESLVRQMASFVDLPLVERALPRFDSKETNLLLDEVYGFVCYRMDI